MDGVWGFQKVELGCGGWSLQIVFQSLAYTKHSVVKYSSGLLENIKTFSL